MSNAAPRRPRGIVFLAILSLTFTAGILRADPAPSEAAPSPAPEAVAAEVAPVAPPEPAIETMAPPVPPEAASPSPEVPPASTTVADAGPELPPASVFPGGSGTPPAQAAVPPPPAGPSADMLNLLDLLVDKGVISRDDSKRFVKQAEARTTATRIAAAGGNLAPVSVPGESVSHADDDTVRVHYVPDSVKDEMREEIKNDVLARARDENWASPHAFPDWLSRISLFGDVRVRVQGDFYPSNNQTGYGTDFWNYNSINTGGPYDYTAVANPPYSNNDQNRNRIRLRARFGLDANLGDGFSSGVRVGTGQDDSPVSENQTLGGASGQGGNFSKYAIWLDRAFVSYELGATPEHDLKFTAGRFDNPFFGTTMLWSEDIGFDGFVAKGRYQATDEVRPFAAAGAFPVYNTDLNFGTDSPTKFHSEDKWLYAAQAGTDWKIDDDFSLKVAGAVYWFQNIEGKVSSPFVPLSSSDSGDTDDSRPAFAQRGNTYVPLRDITPVAANDYGTVNQWQYFGLATPFHEAALTARLDYGHFDPVHLSLTGEFVDNFAFDRRSIETNGPPLLPGPVNNVSGGGQGGAFQGGNLGYFVNFVVGSPVLAKRWDWNVGLGYRYVESDATVDGFCDQEFGGGGTNLKGYTLSGSVAFSPRVWARLRFMSADSIAGPTYGDDTVQLDLNAKF